MIQKMVLLEVEDWGLQMDSVRRLMKNDELIVHPMMLYKMMLKFEQVL
jgi:hypothetical protein